MAVTLRPGWRAVDRPNEDRVLPVRRATIRFALVAVLLVAGWVALRWGSNGPDETLVSIAPGEPGIRGLIVEPDDGRTPILAELDAATRSIDLMIYLLSDRAIIDALVAAEGRGVELRVIIERDPFGGGGDPEGVAAQLLRAGAEVRYASDRFTFTHAKALVVDDKVALILNLNLARSAFEGNREFGVISTKPADVSGLQSIFESDWEGGSTSDNSLLVTSPGESRSEVVRMIDGAAISIDIYAEVIRDREVIDLLLAAERRGVPVRVVISADDAADSLGVADRLIAGGVELRYANGLYIHAKLILVDGREAFVGSQNLTQTSLDENREIGIVVKEDDIIVRVTTIFESDFAEAA